MVWNFHFTKMYKVGIQTHEFQLCTHTLTELWDDHWCKWDYPYSKPMLSFQMPSSPKKNMTEDSIHTLVQKEIVWENAVAHIFRFEVYGMWSLKIHPLSYYEICSIYEYMIIWCSRCDERLSWNSVNTFEAVDEDIIPILNKSSLDVKKLKRQISHLTFSQLFQSHANDLWVPNSSFEKKNRHNYYFC